MPLKAKNYKGKNLTFPTGSELKRYMEFYKDHSDKDVMAEFSVTKYQIKILVDRHHLKKTKMRHHSLPRFGTGTVSEYKPVDYTVMDFGIIVKHSEKYL